MLKYSEGARNGLMVTGSLRTLLTGTKLKLYSGTVPASPNDSIGAAVLLGTITVDDTGTGLGWEAAASGGTLAKSASETWQGTIVTGGVASFFRFVEASDADGVSFTLVRVQGVIGVAGADLNLSSTTLTAASVQTIDSAFLTMPEV